VAFIHNDHIRRVVLSLTAAVVLAGCLRHPDEDPTRPKKVPKTASWTRSSYGIVWIVCTDGKHGDQCAVFSGTTGDTLIKGTFLVVGTNTGLPADTLSYDYFDGKRILLGDGRMLKYSDAPNKDKTATKGRLHRKKQA
jgi:hypothetical protein